MIKNYLELNVEEKNLVNEFISRKDNNKKSLEEVDKMFNGEVYDNGMGALFYFQQGNLIGKGCVVLELAKVLHAAYIHSIDILEEVDNEIIIIKEIIDKAILMAKKYGAEKIKLGIRDEHLLRIAEKLGLHKSYSAFIMTLEDRNMREEVLELVSLTEENMEEYIEVYNDSFKDMPHGTFIDSNECKEYLEKSNDENYYFFGSMDGVNIGFMNCTIEKGEGTFDIGLCKRYRGQGYGKRILETAIDFLNKRKVDKVRLIVIEKNSRAFEMYKKRGFKVESILSSWIEIL